MCVWENDPASRCSWELPLHNHQAAQSTIYSSKVSSCHIHKDIEAGWKILADCQTLSTSNEWFPISVAVSTPDSGIISQKNLKMNQYKFLLKLLVGGSTSCSFSPFRMFFKGLNGTHGNHPQIILKSHCKKHKTFAKQKWLLYYQRLSTFSSVPLFYYTHSYTNLEIFQSFCWPSSSCLCSVGIYMSWHIIAYDLFSGNQRPQFPAPTIKLSKMAYCKNKIVWKKGLWS